MYTLKVKGRKKLVLEEDVVTRRSVRKKKVNTGITEVDYEWDVRTDYRKSDVHLCRTMSPNDLMEQFCSGPAAPTMADVDRLIFRLFPTERSGKEVEVGPLKIGKVTLPNAQRIDAAGEQYDCLMHSILTCSCRHFRTLGPDARGYFAREFRTVLLPRLMRTYDLEPVSAHEQQGTLQRLTSVAHDFLTDSDFHYIMNFFKMSGLCFQKGGDGDKPQVNEIGFDSRSDPIVVYGDRTHFEPVRVNGLYTVPRREVAGIKTRFNGQHFEVYDAGYRFNVRDRVRYHGTAMAVAERRTEAHGRTTQRVYFLLPVDEVAGFTEEYLNKTNFYTWPSDRITRATEDELTA